VCPPSAIKYYQYFGVCTVFCFLQIVSAETVSQPVTQFCDTQDVQTAPILEYPPTGLSSISAPMLFSDANLVDQLAWTGLVSGQLWGNGMYEVRCSSAWTSNGAAYYQMWQMFDKLTITDSFFALNHYSTSTRDYNFGNKAGYTLDQQYYGELYT
jgi:hypothetical protein